MFLWQLLPCKRPRPCLLFLRADSPAPTQSNSPFLTARYALKHLPCPALDTPCLALPPYRARPSLRSLRGLSSRATAAEPCEGHAPGCSAAFRCSPLTLQSLGNCSFAHALRLVRPLVSEAALQRSPASARCPAQGSTDSAALQCPPITTLPFGSCAPVHALHM